MGNGVSSPGPKCLPKPTDEKFFQELIDRGVYYRSPKEDKYMWDVTLPPGWGYLNDENGKTFWGGSIENGRVVDDNGCYVATIVAQSSGHERKESAYASISKASGKIHVRWSINEWGYVTLNNDDLIREAEEKQKREADRKKMMEDEQERKKYQTQMHNHNESVLRYQGYAKQYKERLGSMDKQSSDYEKYMKIYGRNLKNEYEELVKSAERLHLEKPEQIKLDF